MADEEVFEVEMVGGDGPALITLSEAVSGCRLTVEHAGTRIEAEADGAFEALCAVRRRLEARGLFLKCYGASLDVYPSAMSLDMGGGRMAYRLVVGCRARQSDLFDVFASGSDVLPATVDDQRRYFETWLEGPWNRPATAPGWDDRGS